MKQIMLLLFLLIISLSCTAPNRVDTEDIVKYDSAFDVYNNKKNYSEAIPLFKIVIDNYPWSSKVDNSWYYTGRSYQKLLDTTNAISAFKNVPEKSSLYSNAQNYIANLEKGN